jgi:hypothetical protein
VKRVRLFGAARAAGAVKRFVLLRTPAYDWLRPLRGAPSTFFRKSPVSGETPHRIKEKTVLEHAERFQIDVLVETGTYLGAMIDATKHYFREIHSIELGPELCRRARTRFRRDPRIHIEEGDSGDVLPRLLTTINRPCVFWLDGHFSMGITARGSKNTPIVRELEAILAHPVANHLILIDDARCFTGNADFPTMAEVLTLIEARWPGAVVEVAEDIIRVLPPQ